MRNHEVDTEGVQERDEMPADVPTDEPPPPDPSVPSQT
jgi:hypothetical protein